MSFEHSPNTSLPLQCLKYYEFELNLQQGAEYTQRRFINSRQCNPHTVHKLLDWNMEWNDGMESRVEQRMYTIRVTGTVLQGCASYYVSRALISQQRL